MYDVQYDAATHGFKINRKSVFANHKGAARMLKALVLIFNGVHLRKMFGINNLLLKLNMYVFSSRCSRFKNSKNVIFSSILKYFKILKTCFACCCTFFC
jgi:hypothetical protein